MALRSWKFASPLGADGVIFADKVMFLKNDWNRNAWDPIAREALDGDVANGEIGMIVQSATEEGRSRRAAIKIEFSTQPARQYTFWDNELNGDDEGSEWIELAYAVTIHKSQGSQFRLTFVVIPDPCPLLSPELLYTALTRQQNKVVILKQGSTDNLRDYRRARALGHRAAAHLPVPPRRSVRDRRRRSSTARTSTSPGARSSFARSRR